MKFFRPTTWAAALLITAIGCNRNDGALDKSSSLKENLKSEEVAISDLGNNQGNPWEQEKNKHQLPGNKAADTTITPSGNLQSRQQTEPGNTGIADWDKKIVKIASINLEVRNYKTFSALMKDDVKKFGGYIAQQNQSDYKIENSTAIKVPVDQFDNLVAELTKEEEKIIEKKITSQDVTTDIIDAKSRLEAKKQVRLRYLELLKQARNMQDILNVQNEINGIQEDIEATAGRIGYLSHASSYSTINLTYFQILDVSAKDTRDVSYGTKLWQSFKNGWTWVGDLFIGTISIWPLFLLGFVCWFAYKKWLLAKMHKRNG